MRLHNSLIATRFLWNRILPLMLVVAFPLIATASVESSLNNIQMKLTRVILPSISVCGIAWASISLLSGNEKAKTHVFYAIVAAAFGFGAQAIVDFIRATVN